MSATADSTSESARLAALRAFHILDTEPDPALDDLTRLASFVCGTPIALVSLVDESRQWFLSEHGLGAKETPREKSFCAHALARPDPLLVPDAAADPRFAANPLVTGDPHIRFYAGVPLTDPGGHNLGTLCVIDRTPRELTPVQLDALRTLARQAMAHLVLRRQAAELAAAEARFRAFMDNCPAVAFMKDEAGRFVYVNEPLARRFGMSKSHWLGRTDADLWPAEMAGRLQIVDRAVLETGETRTLYESVPTPDGAACFWQVFEFPLVGPGGRRFLAGMAVDRTREKQADDALRASEAMFRSTVDRLAEGVFVVDAATGRFVDANAALLAILGYTPAEFAALDSFDIVAGETPEVFARNIHEMHEKLARDGRCDVGRRLFRRKDGSAVPVDIRVTVVPSGGAGLHAVIVRDVTAELEYENRLFSYQSDLEEANAKLRALAVTDGLTGVRNRAAFDERLAEEYDRAVRYDRPLSVLLMDVDHFKAFNDTFGHPAGDDALKAVARLLTDTARATDFVARYGGEEFAVILTDTDFTGAMVLAERFRRAVAGADWPLRSVTISLGAATLGPATADPAALLSEADAALYQSKSLGWNRVSHGSGATAATMIFRR